MSNYITREQVIDVLKETGIIQDNDLWHLVVDEINRIPTVDETELIHKTVERVVERLEEMKPDIECFEDEEDYLYAIKRHNNYIKTVKEVGGLYDSTRSKNNC